MLYGIDAHTTYQQGLRVGGLADEGYQFGIFKATQGVSGFWAPAEYDQWVASVRAQGMVPGAYHWLTNSDPVRQIDRFLDRVGNPAGMLCAIDYEDTKSVASRDQVVTAIRRWFDRTGGHPIGLYSGQWFVDGHASWLNNYRLAGLGPVWKWDSRYVNGNDYGSKLYAKVPSSWWNTGWGQMAPTILQFSSKAKVGGLARVDVDAYPGTVEQLRVLVAAPGQATPAAGGGTVSVRTDETIEAWRNGMQTLPDGKTPVCPVIWQVRNEAWQQSVNARFEQLAAALAVVAQQLANGGGSPETAALLTRMAELAEADRVRDEAAHAEIAELRRLLADRDARLAAALGGQG